jgi:lipopolysaccharide biosynthesis protein
MKMSSDDKKLRALALYLPQYHPIPENDEWWGKGFTEWRNVVKGTAIVDGQYQPHLPKDLGFYDLRLPEIREQQANLAKESGIYGFCYYHYWFHGKRLIESPLNEVLASNKPDFPFCLCWANESWSRNWDGKEKQVLMKQEYSIEDDKEHIKYLCENVFNDSRYITVDGKPVFIIYRPSSFPDMKKTVSLWRSEAKRMGFKDIYFIFFWAFDYGVNPAEYGMDAAALFTPNPLPVKRKNNSVISRALNKLGLQFTNYQKHSVYEYKDLVDYAINNKFPDDFTLYPCVTPMWDNYARRKLGGAKIYVNSTPALYEKWLSAICKIWKVKKNEENFLFINAWNEWAEGNHLEPCERWDNQYLEATKRVLEKY